MIYFLGDVHGCMHHVLPTILSQNDGSTAVVFLGDIEAQQPFEEEIRPLTTAGIDVWFIHGNHDTDHQASWNRLQASTHRNLDGRVVEIQGVRVAGLGGVFRQEVWYPDRNVTVDQNFAVRNYDDYIVQVQAKTPPRLHASVRSTSKALKHRSTIFPDTYEQLAGLRADILVLHEAPSCHPYGFPTLDVLAQTMGVTTVFHGHHHDSADYRFSEKTLGFRTHGVGFRCITDIHGCRLVPERLSRIP